MSLHHSCLSRTGGIPTACLQELPCWPGEDRRADGQLGILGHTFPLTSQELPSEKTILEMEAESFVHWSTWDWTKASQVICHLLMGLISGWRVKEGGCCMWQPGLTVVFRVTLLQVYFFSQKYMLPFTDLCCF